MAPVTPPTPGSPTEQELQRELEQVRAAQPPDPGTPSSAVAAPPTLAQVLRRRLLKTLGLWLLLVVAFLAIWQFLVPAVPQPREPAGSAR
jgi:hypothetical protein